MAKGAGLMRAIFASVVMAMMLCAPAFAAEDIPALLKNVGERVASFKSLKTDFVQDKDLAMFKRRLTIKGRIYLQKPSKVAWHVDSPIKYSVLMTDKFIRQWDEESNKVQEVSLAKNVILQNVLNQLNVWFSGNFVSLLQENEVRVLSQTPLALEFAPNQKNIAKDVIKRIVVTFRDDGRYLKSIRIEEVGKDVTTINFINTVIDPVLDDKDFQVKRGG